MKLTFPLFVFMAFSLSVSAQITIKGSDITVKAGDSLKTYPATAASLANIPAFKTGGNQVWDFSKLAFENFYYYDPISKANNSAYPSANLSYPSSASLGAIVIPTTRFLEKSATAYRDLGFSNLGLKQVLTTITGSNKDTLFLPATDIKYTDNIFSFPVTMGANQTDKWTQNRPYALTVAAFGLNKTPGVVKNIVTSNKSVVAWGKVILPDFKNKGKTVTYNTIVQLTSVSLVDSVFLGGAPAPAPLMQAFGLTQGSSSSYTYFSALVPGFKTIAVEGDLNANLKATSIYVATESGFVPSNSVGSKDVAEQIESNVFPNPSQNGQFTLSFDKPNSKDWTVKIYDLAGREMSQTKITGEGKITQPLSVSTEKGTYFYALFNENQQFVNNGVLLVE
jgi:Secretion system C-terminal sorting domain